MKKQAVLSVLLIFLFAIVLLYAGLIVSERALQQVVGVPEDASTISLARDPSGAWVFTFAGRSMPVDHRIWQVFKTEFEE